VTPIQALVSILRDPGVSGLRGIATLGVFGTIGAAALNIGLNAVYSGVALEVGITIGSVASAVPVYGTDQNISEWWADYFWDILHEEDSEKCP
jgi:hypothetical protein